MFVQDAMTPQPVTVSPGATVKEAMTLLAEHHVTALPVVDADGRIRGVTSEADLIREAVGPDPRAHVMRHGASEGRPAAARRVEDVMTSPAVTVHARTDLADAVELMTSTGFKGLPVVDDHDRVIGVVSRSDVVGLLARTDSTLQREVDSRLAALGHPDWLVEVHDGVVQVVGPVNDDDRTLAGVAARTVAGVVDVRIP